MRGEIMGYIGFSRSVRSAEAIRNLTVPLSMFSRGLWRSATRDFSANTRNAPIAFVKFCAIMCGASEWHHTSSYFNATDHYDLVSVAEFIEDEDYDVLYKKYKAQKCAKKPSNGVTYAVVRKTEWGGSRRFRRCLGEFNYAGKISGNWLVAKNQPKIKLNGNSVVAVHKFDKWSALTKKFPEFKGKKGSI